jgi:hypothetical protein
LITIWLTQRRSTVVNIIAVKRSQRKQKLKLKAATAVTVELAVLAPAVMAAVPAAVTVALPSVELVAQAAHPVL